MKQLVRVCQKACLLVVLALLSALAVAIPLILTLGDKPAGLRGVAVLAAGPDRHTIASPVSLLQVPDVTVENGTLAIQRQHGSTKSKSSVQGDLDRLQAGRHALVLDSGQIRIKLKSRAPQRHPANGRYVTVPSSSKNTGSPGAMPDTASHGIELGTLAPMMSALAEHRYTGLALRGCKVLFENAAGDVARLDDVNIDIEKRSGTSIHLQGTFRFRGETVQVSSDIGTAPQAQVSVPRVPISTRLTSRLLKAEFDGELVLSSPLHVVADNASMEMMSAALGGQWFGIPWPASSDEDVFTANGRLAWSPRAIAFENAVFSLGGNRAAGALSLTYGDKRPLVAGTLAARDLDLETFFLRPTTGAPLIDSANSWLARLGVPAWSGFSAFVSAIDADVRISARKLTGTGFDAASAAVALSLNNGKMLADIAEVEFYNGGTANLQFSFDASSAAPKASLRARLNGIEIADAMRHVFDHELLAGRGDMSVDLNGSGADRASFMNSASGKVNVSMPGTATLTLPKGENAPDEPVIANGPVPLAQLHATITMANGVATFAPLTANAQFGPVTLKGWVSLPRQLLDVEILVSSDAHDNTGTPAANRYVLQKMKIKGPWRAPKIISSDVVDRSNKPQQPPLKSSPASTRQAPL